MRKQLMKILFDLGKKASKSLLSGFHRAGASARKGAEGTPFEKVVKQLNQFAKTPLTHGEALKILNFEDTLPKEKIDPKEVMERFEKYFEANDPKKGGSFYVQSKIYFAKEEIMKDFPEYNISKFNPDKARRPPETEEDRKKREEEEKAEQEAAKAKAKEKKGTGKKRMSKQEKPEEKAKSEQKKEEEK